MLQLVEASPDNTSAAGCLSADTTCRNIWSILVSCGATLLLCVWNAIHPSVPPNRYGWFKVFLYRSLLTIIAFFVPEIVFLAAFEEWWEADQITKLVHDRGHKGWTMWHSHFILIGGFALHDGTSIREIQINEFLSLVDEGHIANPVITEAIIKDKSTSNVLGRLIFFVQLLWFAVQIIVRIHNNLTVTLVELDTICMVLLTVPLIICWWKKPYCPGRPYIFYTHDFARKETLWGAGGSRKLSFADDLTVTTDRSIVDLVMPAGKTDARFRATIVCLLIWSIFGALHAIAWNYEFPTSAEKTIWRVASLILIGLPLSPFTGLLIELGLSTVLFLLSIPLYVVSLLSAFPSGEVSQRAGEIMEKIRREHFSDVVPNDDSTINFIRRLAVRLHLQNLPVLGGLIYRLLLVAVMLASLRSLPSSAYKTVPWTDYFPHL